MLTCALDSVACVYFQVWTGFKTRSVNHNVLHKELHNLNPQLRPTNRHSFTSCCQIVSGPLVCRLTTCSRFTNSQRPISPSSSSFSSFLGEFFSVTSFSVLLILFSIFILVTSFSATFCPSLDLSAINLNLLSSSRAIVIEANFLFGSLPTVFESHHLLFYRKLRNEHSF